MKNTMIYKAAMLMAALVLLLAACSDSPSDASGSTPVQFAALDMEGADELLASSKGKPVLMCFWTTWCPACREEIPVLQELVAEYGDRIEIAAVSLDEKEEALTTFFRNEDPGIKVYMGSNALAGKYGVSAIPHMVIHGRDGEVALSQAGLFPKEMLTVIIDRMLEQ